VGVCSLQCSRLGVWVCGVGVWLVVGESVVHCCPALYGPALASWLQGRVGCCSTQWLWCVYGHSLGWPCTGLCRVLGARP